MTPWLGEALLNSAISRIAPSRPAPDRAGEIPRRGRAVKPLREIRRRDERFAPLDFFPFRR